MGIDAALWDEEVVRFAEGSPARLAAERERGGLERGGLERDGIELASLLPGEPERGGDET